MKKDGLKIIQEQLETRSEEVQEILGYIPNWIIRWGITVIFSTVIVLLIGSWFFKYPEILTSTITVTTENPPASIKAKSTGKIENIFIKDGDLVKMGQHLGMIENPCSYENASHLAKTIGSLKLNERIQSKKLSEIDLKRNLELGELQVPYEAFLKNFRDYTYFINNRSYEREFVLMESQLDKNLKLFQQSIEQKKIQENELTLFKEKYNRAIELMSKGIISKDDFDSSKGLYLQKRYSLKGTETNITSLEISIEDLRRNILTKKRSFNLENERLLLNLNQSFKTLKAELSLWEQRYLLISPIQGRAVFTDIWSMNQNVNAGERVFSVIPETRDEFIGRVMLPAIGSGKVKAGQSVNIKFSGFPHMEFGMVRGIVKSKSKLPTKDNYILEVSFPDGLKTNYKKQLTFNQEMKGTAEIITEDISLLERIFLKLKSIIKN